MENEDSMEDLNLDRIGDEDDVDTDWGQFVEAVRYSSDKEDKNLDDSENGESSNPSSSSGVAPPCKRQKLNVPYQVQHQQKSDVNNQKKEAKLTAW